MTIISKLQFVLKHFPIKCSFNLLLTGFGKRNYNHTLQNAVHKCVTLCGFAAIQVFVCQTTNRLRCMTSQNTVLCLVNVARTLYSASKKSGLLQCYINTIDHKPYILLLVPAASGVKMSHRMNSWVCYCNLQCSRPCLIRFLEFIYRTQACLLGILNMSTVKFIKMMNTILQNLNAYL